MATFEKLCRWLGVSPSKFLDAGPAEPGVSDPPTTTVTAHLRAKRQISPELAQALGEMILRAQDMLADEPDVDGTE